jgi:hypothetical protein
VQSAEEPNWMIQIWNSVSAQNAMAIMNTARIICLPISISSTARKKVQPSNGNAVEQRKRDRATF